MKPIYMLIAGLLPAMMLSCNPVEDIRVAYDGNIDDYTPVVRKIMEKYPEGNVNIVFDKAVYPFFPEKAVEKYMSVSNNDNGVKPVAFYVSGRKDVRIAGDSTVLLFHGGMVPFLIEKSENVSISGIGIRYDRPFVLEAEVIASDCIAKTFDVRIHGYNDYEVSGDTLVFKGYDWKSGLGENICFNPETRSPYYCTERYEYPSDRPLKAADLGNRVVRLSCPMCKEMPPVGSVIVDKGRYTTNRRYPGIAIQHSSNVRISDVTVYDSGAMALIAENSSNIVCNRYSTRVWPGSGRMIASSADATHFVNCRGSIVLENCIFESMLDDATNVHGTFMRVDKILSDNIFMASFGHVHQKGFDFAAKGDRLLFVDRKSLESLGTGMVEDIVVENEDCYVITTDFSLDAFKEYELAVDNISNAVDSVIIRNCSVKYNRARSLLLSAPGKIVVENCTFASMMAGIRICGDANYWFESGRTEEIVIRNNVFSNLGNGGWSPQAVLQVDPVIPHDSRGNDCHYHRSIVFEDNTVLSFEDQLIYALSVDSLVIRGNRFMDSKAYPTRYPGLSVIDVQYCGKVEIAGNDFSGWKPGASISLVRCCDVQNDAALPVVKNPNMYFYQN